MRIAIIDRSDQVDSAVLGHLSARLDDLGTAIEVQRLLPGELSSIHPSTRVVFVREGYWNETDRLMELAPAVQWVHVNMTGVDHLPVDRIASSGITLTTCRGVLDHAIAEFVLAGVLLWSKGLLRSALDAQNRRATYREPKANSELSALIIGAGNIGTECARVLRLTDFRTIVGIRRTPNPQIEFDEVLAVRDLQEQIARHDIVVSCLPGNVNTAGLLGSSLLSQLRAESIFINVGRGSTVDHEALAKEMWSRPEAVALLDVTDPEPLPSGHPLWDCPNVVISPHMAGDTAGRHDAFASLFIDNLRRFCTGAELLNRVGG